jgi:hypothetical protein
LTSIRTLLAVCALALPIPAVIAGCGDDDDGGDEDPQAVLDATFENDERISSGNLDLTASVSAEGEQGGSFEFSVSGPFQGDADDPAAIPQLDLTGSVSGEGGGQSIDFEGGLVVTEDNAFVEYQGEAYEVGTEQFAQLKEQAEAQAGAAADEEASASFQAGCEQAIEQAGGDPAACDVDFQSWLTDLTNEGTEEVGGTDAVHIHGDADIEQILTDIGELAASVPGAAEQAGFDPSQLSQFSDAVTEASFDVYSGADDDLLRGLDANISIDPSALGAAAGAVPVDSIDVSFSLEIADVNEDQTIEAPTDAQPLDELLGGIPGLGGSGLDFDLGGGGGGAGGGAGGGGGGNADAYLECVAQADPQNAAEINECLDLL